jgi:hypothetical protein
VSGCYSLARSSKDRAPSGVRLEPPDSDNFRHIDLEFLLNVDRAETGLIDCATGRAADPEEAVRQAVANWAATTTRVALEFLEGRGRLAEHFPPGSPGSFPGWHAIIASVSAWGGVRSDLRSSSGSWRPRRGGRWLR